MENDQNTVDTIKNYVVTKSNSLIEAHYELTLTEQKIILFFVSKIRLDDKDFHRYTISVDEFCKLIGYKGRPRYTELSEITKKLLSRVLEIKVGNKLRQFQWVSFVEYNTGEGSITLEFHEKLKPFLLKLKKEFTSYKLKNVMELNSIYSIRLYEILKKWQSLKKIEIPLTDLRKMVGATNKYKEYSNFKKKVLNVAKKELQEKTDISFDYEETKKGRKVVAICFYIKVLNNSPMISQIENDNNLESENKNTDIIEDDDWFDSLYKELQFLFKKHEIKGLTKTLVRRWIDQAEKTWGSLKYIQIRKIAKETLENDQVNNPIGYITHIIQTGKENIYVEPKKIIRRERIPSWFDEDD